MNSELFSHVAESDQTKMHNSEPEIIKNVTRFAHPKILAHHRGRNKYLAEGPQSH